MSPCVSPWLLTQMSLNLTTWLCVSDSIEDFRSLAEQAYRPSLVDKLYANVAKKQRAPRKAKKFASETGKTPHDKSRWHIGFISIHTISFYLWTEEEYEVGAILARRLKKSLGGAQPSMGPESYEYLIKWTDYDTTSWKPYEDLHNCSELLREFLDSSV